MALPIGVPPVPFRIDKRIAVEATGRSIGGGVVQVFQELQLVARLDVPAAEWTILAILAKASHRSAKEGWAHAFVDARTLARDLQRLAGLGDGDPTSLHRVIYRLRKLLSREVLLDHCDDFGKKLIEKHPMLGYRLSAWPDQIELTVLGDEDAGE
jgi:hypothetical protein